MRNVDGGWGWIVVAAAFFNHVILYGISWTSGIYNIVFLEVYRESEAVTSGVIALITSMMYFSGALGSAAINRFGCRSTAMAGSLVTATGLILSFFATDIYFLYFSYGFLTGFGLALTYVPSITIIIYYFDKKTSLASAIVSSGLGVGVTIYPLFTRYTLTRYDWKGSLLLMGGVSLHLFVFSSLFRPIRRLELTEIPLFEFSLLKNEVFQLFCINNFLICFSLSIIYTHLPNYAVTNNITADMSALLITVLGVTSFAGRIFFGCFVQFLRVNASLVYIASFICAGAATMLLPLIPKANVAFLALTVSVGLSCSGWGLLVVVVLTEIVGPKRFSSGYGVLLIFMGTGQVLGAPVAGLIINNFNFDLIFYIAGSGFVLSSFFMIGPCRYTRRVSETPTGKFEEQGLTFQESEC